MMRRMKRSFGKRAALVLWFVGSCGAVLFSCWWALVMLYARRVTLSLLILLALGVIAAWQGFKIFTEERNSN